MDADDLHDSSEWIPAIEIGLRLGGAEKPLTKSLGEIRSAKISR